MDFFILCGEESCGFGSGRLGWLRGLCSKEDEMVFFVVLGKYHFFGITQNGWIL